MTDRLDVSKDIPILRTERLILRPWRDEDLAPFAALNADPAVMEHFPATLTRTESDAAAARIRAELAERGFGLWAVEAPVVAPFIGFTGLSVVRFDAPFTRAAQPPRRSGARSEAQASEVIALQAARSDARSEPQASGVIAPQAPQGGARSEPQASGVIEIGWRLARAHWGRGYAPEAARAALAFGFGRLGLAEIVSFTAVGNLRSRRVMEKIGMTNDPAGDFEHPGLPPGHRLRRHVLYRIRAAQRRST